MNERHGRLNKNRLKRDKCPFETIRLNFESFADRGRQKLNFIKQRVVER